MIELEGSHDLRDPVLLAAFEGWNDAADAASATIDHLATVWKARDVAAIDPDDYYDFQVNRPTVRVNEGGVRSLVWPTTRIMVATLPDAPRDAVLVRGIEPNMRWRQFCDEILAVADTLGVSMCVLLGALLADSPHTRPIPVTASASDPSLATSLGLEQSKYEGPTGILGVLQDSCQRVELPSVMLWAAVPHYVAQPPCPKATLALLRKVEDLLDLTIPLGDLVEDARAWERGVDDLARDDTEVSEYVRSLEEARDAAELPEATGEAIAREFERYLRRRPHGTEDV
ncbi:PAC2 family protein [Thermasporomyces composti]|uniref:Putative ATP-grasp superfamily ATP-dependent carboligase n=1 Tax=Thermasporomyces composti TaxID=696763 RepID=A0A3D9VLU1_THECX|nr:PAC2 family protein [Thermasporomyces composti]REF38341.1 putative ATP-grasp superfamily ATP-dependent carboligase [Thermasporomyces composti]